MDIYDLKYKVNPIQEDIIEELHEKGPLLTSDLRENIGKDRFKAGSRGHHPDKLMEWNLIEVVNTYGAHDEREFNLTFLGEEYYQRVIAGPEYDDRLEENSVVDEDKVAALRERVADLEEIVEEQSAALDRLDEEKVDVSRFESLKEYLQNDYLDEMLGESTDQ